jgi:paraquat-inducible protein B
VYIGIDPVLEGKSRSEFIGLEAPPIVTTRDSGRVFVLRSPNLGSLEIGSPIYFRKVRVGQVVGHQLDASAEFVTIKVFIESPHDQRVRRNTRFWNVSGFDVTFDVDGVRLETESLITILLGGVAFETPSLSPGVPVEAGDGFPLYASRSATLAETYTVKQSYLLHFHESVRGLSPGSPVEFRGIKVGQVTDVTLEFDPATDDFHVPIVIEVEPERIAIEGGDATAIAERLPRLVERGLRARLKTVSLLTGQLAVDLDLHPDAPPASVRLDGPYLELPTLPTPFEEITASLTRLVGRIERLPLENMGQDLSKSLGVLRRTLEETQVLVQHVNVELTPSLVAAAREAERTLAKAGDFVGPESSVNREMRRLLVELVDAARAVRLAAEQVERQPESLLRGKEAGE